MRTHFRWTMCVIAAVFLAVLLGPLAASADTLKNRETGETIRGTLTTQKISGKNLFKMEDGRTRLINLDEWEVISRSEPAAAAPPTPSPVKAAPAKAAPPATPAPAKTGPAKAGPAAKPIALPPGTTLAYVIPISGPIMDRPLVEAIEKAIGEAKAKGATIVIFRMDTPGGRLDLGDEIIRLIEKMDWATTVAWVSGDQKEALSLGAYISLAMHKIYMAPGTTIGAATPFVVGQFSGSARVDEKMMSAFRARFRSLCEQRGHEKAVADAMVDGTTSLVEAWVDGKKTIVSADDAKRLAEEHKNDGKFKRGHTINEPGKPITLTCQEAVDYGIANGAAAADKDILTQMGIPEPHLILAADWVPDWVEKEVAARKAKIEKLRSDFNTNLQKAIASDPHRTMYPSRSTAWTNATDRAIAYLKECARILGEVEKLSKDKGYNLNMSEEEMNDLKAQMEGLYTRLTNDRVPQ